MVECWLLLLFCWKLLIQNCGVMASHEEVSDFYCAGFILVVSLFLIFDRSMRCDACAYTSSYGGINCCSNIVLRSDNIQIVRTG